MMAEIRDAGEVYAEQVAQTTAAVQAAVSTSGAQMAQAESWMSGGLAAEGAVLRPGPADPVD